MRPSARHATVTRRGDGTRSAETGWGLLCCCVALITSRIASARKTDFVLVLENGRITQRGTHDELMARPGFYQEVARSQFAGAAGVPESSHIGRVSRMRKSSRRLPPEDLPEDPPEDGP